jgi:hypothetical protein
MYSSEQHELAVDRPLILGDLKLFEPKTMCLLVTLSDRAEAVVATQAAINAQAGRAVMASRQLRITGRVVLDRGE